MVLTRSTNNIEKDILQRGIFILTTRSLTQFLQRPFGHQHSLINNAHPRTQPLNHFHDMRRKKDRDTTLSQIMQKNADDPRTNRIDAFKWFIEKNDLRTVN